ncbi:hypothetical protein AWB81_01451 [Caballeronia arationis]|jgi:hypothetical protein|uniref:Uncharacterized protein n=1 Tax=Caballeronia arationis TaxID=1777142 RepID=A0A7Z7I817_9BURK|nr:hypothetical protein [Caballeronia arationis]SAK55963.1 hypothetical protein AWB81_01451 [Caballeronia arationis]SOE80999.1 hypothetical protein SAMN05446927_4253 [Caballeronia arationis]
MTTHKLAAALLAGLLATAATASFAQTTTDAPMTHADKKAAKKQAEADKDAAVAQAKADKKKTESQSEANEAAADANLKNAKKSQ